ncbi:class I SAM-dependent methyltransferase [Undibacter mobilis]|uniref:Class I SAM-dependent methyltransferase n=1 Tax=Undibacter mobilis TaxID=2292256 RepID=A0A371B6H0_9BRAD|nr:class I SAM-dependent methyltransferase [Undibacter mobilis]RDV03154.1 class I SAM-dependent methyltransferase [Undibacter mobilis]
MAEIDLLARYPRTKRNIAQRRNARTDEHIRISREYGQMYFDGPREYGYGGYRYDGRWRPIAADMIRHFALRPGMRVLDVGAAKGFLVKDLALECPGLEAFGIDISSYALMNCEAEVVGRLHLGEADNLPFPDHSFDTVVSINTLHNLEHDRLIKALREIMRVTRNSRAYVQVDAYRDDAEKALFLEWVLTAKTHRNPDGWKALFDEAGYEGDYYWTITE